MRKRIFVLATLLACSAGDAFAEANTVNRIADKTSLLLKSHISDHSKSIWKYFVDFHSHGLEFEIELQSVDESSQATNADVVEMMLHDAISACEQGSINLLPFSRILPEKVGLEDHVWNGLQPCGVGHSVWVDFVIFDNTRYLSQSAPESIDDFFNVDLFPGKRALKKSPRALAEWALVIAGVSRQELYQALSREDTWDTIESSLQSIAAEIIWVESDSEALALLDDGVATFALISNQNLVRRINEREESRLPYGHYSVIWDKAIAHMSMLTIPKSHRSEDSEKNVWSSRAIEFLNYVTQPLRNLQLSTTTGYAPVSRMLTHLIEQRYREVLAVDMQLDSLIWSNEKWWRDSGFIVERKFQAFAERTELLKTAKN